MKTLKPAISAAESRSVFKGSSASRMRGDAWQSLRARVLTRDYGLCQACRAAGRLQLSDEVDHIKPLRSGGTDEMGNLQALCRPCHAAKSASESRAV